MSHDLLWKVKEGDTIKLKDYDPDYTGKTDHETADKDLEKLSEELGDLQELLWAAQKQSLLIVLQGMDTSGKDGTIRHVMAHMSPQGCSVASFKQPSAEELGHDFLWRVHKETPAKGAITIFNRSHYEDVLVVRVHDLVSKDIWSKRYKQINHFEGLLAQNDTLIVKFFLHISKEEQEKRLLARQQDKDKAWKVEAGDWKERQYWEKYQKAYEDALSECSTDEAPWYIVPANHKWYRNLAIAQTLVDTLQDYKKSWQKDLEERGKQALEQVQALRLQQK